MDLAAIAVTVAAVYLTTFMKGAFGGGFAIIGIPLMALVMDPVMAGALLAPVFCLSDLLALRYWRVSTWSKPDLSVLIPGQIAGVAAGFALMSVANADIIAVAIATLTLVFAASWFMSGGKILPKPRSSVKGVVAGVASGVSSMVAHAGGPPVAMYLLPLGLSKSVYAGTTFMFFMVGNYLKVGPWLMLVEPTRDWWLLLALSLPIIPLGVWSGLAAAREARSDAALQGLLCAVEHCGNKTTVGRAERARCRVGVIMRRTGMVRAQGRAIEFR